MIATCHHCRHEYRIRPSQAKKTRYCSKQCMGHAQNAATMPARMDGIRRRSERIRAETATMKVCSRCRLNQPLAAFQRDSRYRFGVHGWCKACRAEARSVQDQRRQLLPKVVLPEKKCLTCKQVSPVTTFSRDSRNPDGYSARCKPCHKERCGVSLTRHDTHVGRDLKQRFGMTRDDVQQLFDEQNGCCALCGKAMRRPAIDHDHATMAVRGLLCTRCNTRLGVIEDAEFVEKAKSYLSRYVNRAPRFFANKSHWDKVQAFRERRRQRLIA